LPANPTISGRQRRAITIAEAFNEPTATFEQSPARVPAAQPRTLPDAAPASAQASSRTSTSTSVEVPIENEYPLASSIEQPLLLPDVEPSAPAGPALLGTAPALGTDIASLHLPSSMIISFGSHSDTVIDTFGLSDTIIPRLRIQSAK